MFVIETIHYHMHCTAARSCLGILWITLIQISCFTGLAELTTLNNEHYFQIIKGRSVSCS